MGKGDCLLGVCVYSSCMLEQSQAGIPEAQADDQRGEE